MSDTDHFRPVRDKSGSVLEHELHCPETERTHGGDLSGWTYCPYCGSALDTGGDR